MDEGRSVYRRFNVGDGMIVVAALAVCLAVGRVTLPAYVEGFVPPDHIGSASEWFGLLRSTPGAGTMLAVLGMTFFLMCLVIVSLAFAIMRLRGPRAPIRQVVLQPRVVACEAVLLCTATLWAAVALVSNARIVFVLHIALASAVPVCWALLAITRRWEPEPSWIDRLGRLLGAIWVLATWTYFGLLIAVLGWTWQF